MAKKIKVPKSVLDLRMSPKKYAKKHNIKLKGKISKKERKHNLKRLKKEYSEAALVGLNKAVKILAENPDGKKLNKVKNGVDNIISNPAVMAKIAKLYKKNSAEYQNLIFLPHMIMNTLVYYSSEGISDEDKEIAKNLNPDELISFCEKILKKEIRRYKKMGLDQKVAFQMATVIPTAKLFRNNRYWYKIMINQLYDIAAETDINVDEVIKAVLKIDKKKKISKKDFLEGFFTEFILQKSTNKAAKFTDSQKDLHAALTERALVYLDNLKASRTRSILKEYIKRRKNAEKFKTDGKRVIKFVDHANSNSPYTTIKKVVTELIADDSNNELYLS